MKNELFVSGVGLVQGYFMRPLGLCCFRWFVRIISPKLVPPVVSIFFSSILMAVCISIYFVLPFFSLKIVLGRISDTVMLIWICSFSVAAIANSVRMKI